MLRLIGLPLDTVEPRVRDATTTATWRLLAPHRSPHVWPHSLNPSPNTARTPCHWLIEGSCPKQGLPANNQGS